MQQRESRMQSAAQERLARAHTAAAAKAARNQERESRMQSAAQERLARAHTAAAAKAGRNQARLAAAVAAVGAATSAAAAADAWGVDGKNLKQLLLPPLQGLPSYTQLEDPMPAYIKAASDYRACIEARMQTGEAVCCVCARYLQLVTKDKGAVLPKARDPAHKAWHEVPAADIPGKQVLVTAEYLGNDANGVAIPRHTPEMPRVGLTTYTIGNIAYCLEPAGIVSVNGEPCCPHNTLKWSHLLVCR
jgi:hypothetical protein